MFLRSDINYVAWSKWKLMTLPSYKDVLHGENEGRSSARRGLHLSGNSCGSARWRATLQSGWTRGAPWCEEQRGTGLCSSLSLLGALLSASLQPAWPTGIQIQLEDNIEQAELIIIISLFLSLTHTRARAHTHTHARVLTHTYTHTMCGWTRECVCVCVYMCVRLCVCVCVHIHTRVRECTSTRARARLFVRGRVFVSAYASVHARTRMCGTTGVCLLAQQCTACLDWVRRYMWWH